ncbi:globoside alpha-1,3-N-acetylgalactosaminyltransferase 1 isoform X7 [Gorilla gorilla gorilla]|uniref:globoside alpha-1,3-N-acetylgalactosaminyltransferase 1 isoform X7 n=1 Tax=Gorilla gorilla gorilla TaxID=9595 RepID=UPI00300B61DD
MHRRRLALGLGFCLLAGTSLSVLWVYLENWLPVSYVPYYLPCPEIFLTLKLTMEAACQDLPRIPHLTEHLLHAGHGQEPLTHLVNMKLHYKREKPLQPVVWSQYPQPKLLEHRYTHFIQSFLESAEEFFMRGYRVHYYIFTDNPAAVPGVPLGPHRLLSSIPIQGHSHWEETSMRRMETVSQHIAKRAHQEVDYLFCLDVDMVFRNPWGPETLGDLVAAIHPSYYAVPRQQFPYERRRVSTAFVADSEGDFYYGGAVFGGQVARVYEFTRGCHMTILADKANGIMAAWREESHLNRRFISNKPSKVLSPEYLWDDRKPQPPSLKLIRFSTLDKDISCLRS